MFSPQPLSGSAEGGGGGGGGGGIHPQVIVTVEGSMRIITMEPQGKQIPFSSSVGLLAVRDRPNTKVQGRMRKFRLPVAPNSSGIMCSAASLPPLRGTRVRAADGDLAVEPRSTSGPCCVDFFPKKYRWSGNTAGKKITPLYKRRRKKKKDRALGNSDFSS